MNEGRCLPCIPTNDCTLSTNLIAGEPDQEWEEHLNEGWDRAAAQAVAAQLPDLALQVGGAA